MTTNHGSPVPPASAPAATAGVIPASPDTTWFANYPLCAGGNVARFTRPVPPTKHCGDPSCPCMSERSAAPTGEAAETPTLDELRADVSAHFAQLASWARDQQMRHYASDVEADAALVDSRLTAQASELAALRARVDHVTELHDLDDWHEDDGVVLWWRLPVDEPPYCGTPLDTDWPGYHTCWTVIPEPLAALAPRQPPEPPHA